MFPQAKDYALTSIAMQAVNLLLKDTGLVPESHIWADLKIMSAQTLSFMQLLHRINSDLVYYLECSKILAVEFQSKPLVPEDVIRFAEYLIGLHNVWKREHNIWKKEKVLWEKGSKLFSEQHGADAGAAAAQGKHKEPEEPEEPEIRLLIIAGMPDRKKSKLENPNFQVQLPFDILYLMDIDPDDEFRAIKNKVAAGEKITHKDLFRLLTLPMCGRDPNVTTKFCLECANLGNAIFNSSSSSDEAVKLGVHFITLFLFIYMHILPEDAWQKLIKEKDMYSFIDMLNDNAREEGIKKGIEKGREEGIEKGRLELTKQIQELGSKIGFDSAEFIQFIKLPPMEQDEVLKAHNITI